MNLLVSPDVADRDPVAASVEDFLEAEMAKGNGRLSKRIKKDGFCVSFSNATAIGPSYDIAFIRLAVSLLDDDLLSRGLRDALRENFEEVHL